MTNDHEEKGGQFNKLAQPSGRGALKKRIAKLQAEYRENEAKVAAFGAKIAALQKDVAMLENAYSNLH